jgi:hypothetical protein
MTRGSRLYALRSDSVAIPAPTPIYPHFLHSRRGRHFTIYSSDGWIVKPPGDSLSWRSRSQGQTDPDATATARIYRST